MSKAVLVLDEMPEFCGKCRLCVLSRTEFAWGCVAGPGAGWQSIDAYAMQRPDWCPLREMPEPKEVETEHYDTALDHYFWGFADGYNTCLDDIGRNGHSGG